MEKKPGRAPAVMGMIGGLSGMIAIFTIVFYGGALAEQVKALNTRVTVIEGQGSSPTREHIKMDEERVRAIHDRVVRLENAALATPEELSRIRAEIAAINANMQFIKERVNKL